jgi:hypothetical protein
VGIDFFLSFLFNIILHWPDRLFFLKCGFHPVYENGLPVFSAVFSANNRAILAVLLLPVVSKFLYFSGADETGERLFVR